MTKLLLFFGLTWLFGNPFVAIIVLLLVFYFLDRRFIGLTPSILKPIKQSGRLRKLKRQIEASPSDTSAKQDASRILIEKKKYREALALLERVERALEDSAEYWDDLSICLLAIGEEERGAEAASKALAINPRVKYGAPYLRLAAFYAERDASKALDYIASFQHIQSSSCEAYLRLASVYKAMGREHEGKQAIEGGLRVYRELPKYRKKAERQWAIRLLWKRTAGL
ncbi:tetratricopeptide repeat protein [Paenibacillus sp. NPDC058071]|uniref:tetratricopeptide repeat protein n=1 Tax=Paenibacillus sp. NPDC058071 TaxID=3346326 RepID=UPI0036D86F74